MTEAQEKRRERNRRYYENQKAKKAAGRSARIGDVALARSRQKPARAPTNIFAPYAPPASVGKGMALDSSYQDTLGWASGGLTQDSGSTGFLGYPALSELAQRPEYRRISEILAMEMTRGWVRLKADGDEDKSDKIKSLEEAMGRLHVRDVFREAVEQDGFFGRGHIYLDFGVTDDREELCQSVGDGWNDISRLKVSKGSLRRLRAVEAVWCYPNDYNSFDPLRPDWFKPTTWMVQGKEVHSSRLLTIIGREVPDLLKPAYSFGGLSLSQMAKPYVDNWLRTRQSVADLISSFSVFVLKTNLSDKLSMDPNGDALFARADFFNNMRDNRGLMLTDKELEDFANVSTSLSTLDALQAQTQEHMASVSGIPLVKLLGIQPAGLNASSEGELECFYTWINALQESMLSEPLRVVLGFIQLSLFGEVDPAITFSWEPLKQVTEKEAAEIRKINAETGQVLIAGKAISPEEERQRIASDDDSIYDSIDVAAAPADRLTPVEKATVAVGLTGAIVQAESSGLVDTPLAMEELRKLSQATGVWTSITEMDVVEAKLSPPPEPDFASPTTGGAEQSQPPFEGGQDEGFSEEDHPRDDDGRFSDGAGGASHGDNDEDDGDLDEDGAPPPPSTLSPPEQAAIVAAALEDHADPYSALQNAIGDDLSDVLSDQERDLHRAALFEARNAPLEEKAARGAAMVLDDYAPIELSDRDVEKMDRFVGARFTQDDMGDVIGAPLASVAERHADELRALAPSFRDRFGGWGEGYVGKTSPWDQDDWEADQWTAHEDDEDYAGPTPEEAEAARRKVEDPWFAKTFGDELSLGLKEAMARLVRPYEEPPEAFLADIRQTVSGLSGADAKARMGAPFFDTLAGMRSVTRADLERVRDEGGEESNFARYARLVKSSPDEAARIAPKLTERLSAYLERARKEGAPRPFDGGMDAGWEEDDHPRDEGGKFTKGAGGAAGTPKLTRLADAPDGAERRKLKESWFSTQPERSFDDLYSGHLDQRQAELNQAGENIASATGAELKSAGVKERETAEEKMKRKGYASTARLTDLVRNGYIVDRPEQADEIVRQLAERFDVLDEGWILTGAGYFDRKVGVRMEDGTIGEVQIWPRDLYAAKKGGGHTIYKERRGLPEGDARRDELGQREREIYSAALAKDPSWEALSRSIGSGGSDQSSNMARIAASEGSTPAVSHTSSQSALTQSPPGTSTAQHPLLPGTREMTAGRRSQSKNATSRIGKSSEENIGAPKEDDNEK